MAAPSKVVDHAEVMRWMDEGKTYKWMVEEYRRKYHVETSVSMWSGFRSRHGLDRRAVRNDTLIPWALKDEHRYAHPINMLRAEARRREGHKASAHMRGLVDGWINGMRVDGTVLEYRPDTKEGWFYVPRRPGIDRDLIREPDKKTTKRLRRD